jgi:integrase
MSFCISKRANYPNYYVSYKNPLTGKYGTKKSTGTSDRKLAERKAYEWLFAQKENSPALDIINAIKTTDISLDDSKEIIGLLKLKGYVVSAVFKKEKSDQTLIAFLRNFWDKENSPYIREKKRKEHGIHNRYILNQGGRIENYWEPFFKDMLLCDITKEKLNSFIDHLANSEVLKTFSGKNQVIKAGTIALKWAYRNEYLEKDITAGLMYFSGTKGKREILTPELAMALFREPWRNETSKLANLLAMCTGLRAGEIQALRKKDLGRNCLYVRHSWNYEDGLKPTKNNEERVAEIVFPELMGALIDKANANPYGENLDGFIFYATVPGKPSDSKIWLADLREVCEKIGIKNTEKISFHGWRHFFTTYMHGKVEDKILQRATGHKTNSMLEHYANHRRLEDQKELARVQRKVFEPIISLVNF